MTKVVVTESHNTSVVSDQIGQKSTVVVTGILPPLSVTSIQTSADVDLTQLQDGGLLVYNANTQKWVATNLLEKQIFEAGQF